MKWCTPPCRYLVPRRNPNNAEKKIATSVTATWKGIMNDWLGYIAATTIVAVAKSRALLRRTPMILHPHLTPELSRAALRPWASENYGCLHEAAKRARLERIVRCRLGRLDDDTCDWFVVYSDTATLRVATGIHANDPLPIPRLKFKRNDLAQEDVTNNSGRALQRYV